MANLENVGSIAGWITVNNGQWPPGGTADLPPIQYEHVTIETSADSGRLSLTVSGIFSRAFAFSCPLPELKAVPRTTGQLGFHIGVTWKRPRITAYVNGEEIGSKKLKLH